ncbi:bifunctional riboflavin kinase/FAD synthetase [Rhodobacteraceae bacterium NNCM2]|nr:bifunctional riboflavin kinase/FAD synthetase [Coraliihabitans acroporae]
MKVHSGYDIPDEARGASVALGNFDGVHRGHRALIAEARAAHPEAPLGVISFNPHPRRFFQPDAPPFLLTTQAEKIRRLTTAGVEHLFNLPFDSHLSSMTPEEFIQNVLVDGFGISHVVVGEDFRFGKKRAGDAAHLRQWGDEQGFGVTIQHLLGDENGEYGSTAIRVMVTEGRCLDAAAQLGCWHAVSGPVVKGDQRGRDLGYPTANLAFGEQITPAFGVYASRVTVHDGPHKGIYDGVASIGERPTFGVNAPNFEVHIFDFAGDLYGAEISAALVSRLRGEEKFDSIDALITQMDADSAAARERLASAQIPG